MTTTPLNQALENIYTSVNNDNEDIDLHIAALKSALDDSGQKEAVIDPARLQHNNRQGRKMMESYFRKRGVTITFKS